MTGISPLAMKAKQVIEAQWLHGPAYDLATQAAEALEDRQMLQSPEAARELVADAVRVAEEAVAELRREHEESARLRAQLEELQRKYTLDTAELKRERDALQGRVAELTVAVETPELCADCGHMEDAHKGDGDTNCTASGARLAECTCAFFIPRYDAAELVVAPPQPGAAT
ncbi:hypothetical protein [Streptomyces sp. NPDC004658]|uniref:hypothetical protein n=1 Tax=Streptomyces sp. NPDC004658 TaxID=3154672 RepID=UPI0033AFE6FC